MIKLSNQQRKRREKETVINVMKGRKSREPASRTETSSGLSTVVLNKADVSSTNTDTPDMDTQPLEVGNKGVEKRHVGRDLFLEV